MTTKDYTARRETGYRGKRYWRCEGCTNGTAWMITAYNKKEADLLADCTSAFIRANPMVQAKSFVLYTNGLGSFVLVFPGRRGSTIFGAQSLRDALIRVGREYGSHGDVQAFISAVLADGLKVAARDRGGFVVQP
jgi:hypothetical protein